MGTVHLTNGHHGLYVREPNIDMDRRVVLDPEWLDRPIIGPGGRSVHERYQRFARAALRALLALPVNSAVSYHVVGVGGKFPQLQEPKRVWGELTLKDPTDVIVGFSHDSRFGNSPHVHHYQWLEDKWNPHFTPEEDERFWQDWSDASMWKIYFDLRLRQASNQLRHKAKQMQQEAGELQRKANKISSLLKKP